MLYPADDRQYDPRASRPERLKHSLIIITLKVDPNFQHCNVAGFQPSAITLGPSKSGQSSKVYWHKPILPVCY